MPNTVAYTDAMNGERGWEYYISKPLWSSGKIYASGSPSSGLKRTILFLEISLGFPCIFRRKDQQSCDVRGGGHYIFCVVILYIIRLRDQRSCDGQDGDWGT